MTIQDKGQRINCICYLFLIFLIGCLAGWIYEEIFYWITEGLLRNRGVLYGPWLPIYGVGALGIYAIKPFKKNPVVLFLLCAGITGVVEYLLGLISIYCFGLRLWDYRGELGNIGGIVVSLDPYCIQGNRRIGIVGLTAVIFGCGCRARSCPPHKGVVGSCGLNRGDRYRLPDGLCLRSRCSATAVCVIRYSEDRLLPYCIERYVCIGGITTTCRVSRTRRRA